MDPVFKGYINNLRLVIGKMGKQAEQAQADLEAGNYEQVKKSLELLKLTGEQFTAERDYSLKQEAERVNESSSVHRPTLWQRLFGLRH